jgi:glycosyltransferase involved in cell wall biosynthesis
MLVTNVGGLAETIPHMQVGYVVEPDPNEIAAALIDFFENKRLEDFTNNILKEKERFSWDKMTNSIIGLTRQIKKKKAIF